MSRRRTQGRPQQQPQQQVQMNIDLSQADNVTCQSCGNYTFVPVMLMKRVSAIMSPTGEEAIVPIQSFSCNACGFINKEFLPRIYNTDEDAVPNSGTGDTPMSTGGSTGDKPSSSPIITTDLNV